MLFGVYFISFVIGSLSNMFSSIDTKEKILVTKLAIIDEFSDEVKLEKGLRQRIRHALRYSASKSGFSWNEKRHIFNEFPKDLRYEIALAMHGGAARKIHFFLDKDPVVIASIVPFLLPLFIHKSELPYVRGEYSEEIYFILSGRISYIYTDSSILCSCTKGEYFGDIEVIKSSERLYTTRAEKNSELLVMSKFLISTIQTEYPSI